MDELRLPRRVLDGDVAGSLRELMAARRMSARMLASRSGVNHSTITRLITEKRDPHLSTVVALARVLKNGQGGL